MVRLHIYCAKPTEAKANCCLIKSLSATMLNNYSVKDTPNSPANEVVWGI